MHERIKVRNFGPVGLGCTDNDGWIEISKVTLFCGPQGSGKSCITKLISLLTWLEKSAYRDPELKIDNETFMQALEWQNIANYVGADTEIAYHGDLLRFIYEKGMVSAELVFADDKSYVVPKISYMPAERNFASIVRSADRVEGLPHPLVDMQVEFNRAKRFFASGFRLPANGFKFRFDNDPWIVNGDDADANMTRLDVASSGLQSMVPMLLVSEYLEGHLATEQDARRSTGIFYDPGTAEKKERIEAYVRELGANNSLTVAQKSMRLEQYFAPGRRFVNLVEEPEQNLYPETQRAVVNALVAIANRKPENILIMSTHSPYVLNQLVTAALAASIEPSPEVEKVFPFASSVPQADMKLYELDGKGRVVQLGTPNGLFDDQNVLNVALRDWNELFDRLLGIKAREMRGKAVRQDA